MACPEARKKRQRQIDQGSKRIIPETGKMHGICYRAGRRRKIRLAKLLPGAGSQQIRGEVKIARF